MSVEGRRTPEPPLRLLLLGRCDVVRSSDGDVRLRIASQKGRALLAYLASTVGRPSHRNQLAGLLWAERSDRQARQSLRQCLSELRGELAEHGERALRVAEDTVALDPGTFAIDVVDFLAAARTGTRAGLARAIDLYRGELAPDLRHDGEAFDDWLRAERGRLHTAAIAAFETYIELSLAAGDRDAAYTAAERLLALDPLREASHRIVLRAEAARNGRASALARFEQLAQMLGRELDVGPEQDTLDLVATFRNGDGRSHPPLLAPTTPLPASRPPYRRRLALGALAGIAALATATMLVLRHLPAPATADRDTDPAAATAVRAAWMLYFAAPTMPVRREVGEAFEDALRRHPGSAAAMTGVAGYLTMDAMMMQGSERLAAVQRAEGLLATALRQSPRYSPALLYRGMLRKADGRFIEAADAFDRAIELNPSFAAAHAHRAQTMLYLGRAEATEAGVREALRISPADPMMPLWLQFRAEGQMALGNDDAAVAWLEKALVAEPANARTLGLLAVAHALKGATEEATRSIRAARERNPRLSQAALMPRTGSDAHPRYLEQRERLVQGVQTVWALAER